jgi:tripartite-type tricarboxylate transporter receptor subunit TctC
MKRWIGLASAVLAFGATSAALAQKYPERPIRVINPYPVGGSGDTVARVLFEKVGASLGRPIIVESKVGAGGSIGTDYVAKAAPDGYTIAWGTSSNYAVNPGIRRVLPYDARRDFTPIAMVVKAPWLLLAHPSVPANSLPEFIAWTKANPGKTNYGSYGPGTSNHLGFELIGSLTGLDAAHIPFAGGNPMLNALLGGHVHATLDLPATTFNYVKSGRVKLLGVASSKRLPLVASTPTFIEQGVPVEAGSWFAVLAPAGTPPAIIATLNSEINKALALPEVRERMAELGMEIVGGPPSVLVETMTREIAQWEKLVRDRKLNVE